MSRAFSARSEAVNIPGALPQAGNEAAPLAQNRSETIATAGQFVVLPGISVDRIVV
jgi:hypothetical protein